MDFVDNFFADKYKETVGELSKPINPPFKKPHISQSASKPGERRGLVVPGYKYLGPFNSLDRGKPVNKADSAARDHDISYDKQLEAGDNPYIKYNHADEQFQQKLKGDTSLGGNAANAIFQAKKRLLEPFGLVEAPLPKKTDKGKVDDYFPKKKKSKTHHQIPAPPKGNAEEGTPVQSGSNSGSSNPSGSSIMAEGGGGPMADDNQGAEGVGNSSGDWHCDTKWLGDHVITKSTRTWVLPTYGNHLYGPINFDGTTGAGASAAYAGYKTPWGYFDFNRFHCHFSPRDWQRLINNHTGIRPKALKLKLFNVQVKEVTTQDATKTITNNLTSTVQVFADESYDLPYVLGSAQQGTFPPFPNDAFMLPQYAYCTLQGATGKFVDRSAFYCLEYFPSKMLRTGNNFEFQYKFEEVPFHSGWAQSQSLDRLMNPLIDQYLLGDHGTDSTGALVYQRAGPNTLNRFYKNWSPAPYECIQNINSADNTKNANSINADNESNKWGIMGRQAWDAPGFAQASTYEGAAAGTSLLNGVLTFDKTISTTSAPAASAVNRTVEDEIQGTNNFGNARNNNVANNHQSKTVNPTSGTTSQYEIMPGQVWQNRDIYLQGPIWAKIPNTDGHFHPSPRMGGFGLKKPPPLILIKNTPVPADPPTSFSPMPQTSFITEYSTGQVTVEMLWEVQKESSKRWNPEIQFTSNFGITDPTTGGIPFGVDHTGTYVESRPIGSRYITKHL